VILMAYTRPYLGQFAVKPDDLVELIDEMRADERLALSTPLEQATVDR
jgi:hypothetical protein